MSDREGSQKTEQASDVDRAPQGPNLLLVYGWMLVALLVAIGLATLIVLPFYRHR